jgi:hypothetical protein
LVKPTLKVGFGISSMSARVDPETWWVKLTRSVSYWKWPASTVYGTFDLVGRSVLNVRIWSIGTGFRSQYWSLLAFALLLPAFAALLTNGGSAGSDNAEPAELQATHSTIAAAMHEIARMLPPLVSRAVGSEGSEVETVKNK